MGAPPVVHLSYANVVATACLFILLGGTSYAALSITSKDVKPESLTGADIKDGSLVPQGLQKRPGLERAGRSEGLPGSAGRPGSPGGQGPPGTPGPGREVPTGTPVGVRLTLEGGPIVLTGYEAQFGVANDGGFGSGGGSGSGKAVYQDLTITGAPVASTHNLFKPATEGTQFKSAKLELLAPGGATAATIALGATSVTEVATRGAGPEREQTVSLLVVNPSAGLPSLTFTGPALPPGEEKVGEMTGLSSKVDLYEAHWGIEHAAAGGVGGGAGSGKTNVTDFTIRKPLDATSPELYDYVRTGKHLKEVGISIFQPGTANVLVRYVLSDVLIGGYDLDARFGAAEEIAIRFGKLEQFVPGPGGEQKGCYDVVKAANC